MATTFDDVEIHIGPFRDDMINQRIESPNGVVILDLKKYKSVADNSDIIGTALHGHDEGTKTSHPMPPWGKLADPGLAVWDAWIAEGKLPGTGKDGNSGATDPIA
ncbi:MAG: hypothetical protein ACI837_002720 [Crocinitomicaceae bacterium]|jgi:hypothetical protein